MRLDLYTACVAVPAATLASPGWPEHRLALIQEAVQHCREAGGMPGEGITVEILDLDMSTVGPPSGATAPDTKTVVIRVPALRGGT